MANINLSQNSFVDYVASMYFKAMNVSDVEFTPKVVKVGDEDVVLVHISGVQTSSGIKVNVDLWPRNHASAEDSRGLFPEYHAKGEPVLDEEGKPKVDENKKPVVYGAMTSAELAGLKCNKPSDIEFRIGYWPAVDENGEQTLRQGTPKWTVLKNGSKNITLSGEKREFGE
jgi:hypothetical protein